jgi:hypothetical protein
MIAQHFHRLPVGDPVIRTKGVAQRFYITGPPPHGRHPPGLHATATDTKDKAAVLFSNGAGFGTEEILEIIPVRSPNNGRWFVIPMGGNLLRQMMEPEWKN